MLYTVQNLGRRAAIDLTEVFKGSRNWARRFLRDNHLKRRRATRAVRKEVEDPAEQAAVQRLFLARAASIITEHAIEPAFTYMADETSLQLLPASNYTLAEVGAKEVPVLFADDKRAVTLMVCNDGDGAILTPYVVFGVKRGIQELVSEAVGDIVAGSSSSHWMTLPTLQQWIEQVVLKDAARLGQIAA